MVAARAWCVDVLGSILELMPPTSFTLQQDKALLAHILQLPAQRVAAVILFILIRKSPDRDAIVTYVLGL